MAVALRLLIICVLLMGSGCIRTDVPSSSRYTKYTSSGKNTVYRVRQGDTLYSIGKRFGIDHKVLARRNHINRSNTIYVGQHLFLKRTAPRSRSRHVTNITHAKKAKVKKKKTVKKSVKHSRPVARKYSKVRLQWPVKGTLTSKFGHRGNRMHDGIDVGAKQGTPVYAAASGEVVYSDQRLSGYGKLIIIRHSGDMFTAYAHNQRNLVRKGAKVKKGAVIARVGQTGRASGPHLHFEVRRGSTPVDPLAYLPKR